MIKCKGCKSEVYIDDDTPEHNILEGYCMLCASRIIRKYRDALDTIQSHLVLTGNAGYVLTTAPDVLNEIITQALKEEKPACKTCRDSGVGRQEVDGYVAGFFCDCPIGRQKHEAFLKDNPDYR